MWRRSSRDRAALLLLVVATFTVLTLDFRTQFLNGVSGGVTQVVGVFQAGVRTVVRPFEGALTGLRTIGRLRGENERLQRENEMLRRQAETYNDLARENARMTSLLQLEKTLDVSSYIRARVIGASLSGLERSCLIDKGRSSGIVPDSAVLAPDGLLGRIAWAGQRTAKVLLLTDSQSSIGVKVGDSGETGIVTGTGGATLRLELVSRAALDNKIVKRGDVVLTSGYQGGIFPAGIPVGRVEDVILAPRGTSYTIKVRPFASLTRLDIVSVVSRRDGGTEIAPSPESQQTP